MLADTGLAGTGDGEAEAGRDLVADGETTGDGVWTADGERVGFDGVGFDGVLVDERRCNETNRQSRAVKHDAILNSIDSIRADLQCSTDFRTSTKFDAETFELVICELAERIHGGYVFIEKNGKEGTQPENDEKLVQVPGHHRLRVGKIELAVLNWSALKLGGEFISLPVRNFRRPRARETSDMVGKCKMTSLRSIPLEQRNAEFGETSAG